MKKSILAVCFTLMSGLAGFAQADAGGASSGVIHFYGSIVEAPCTMTIKGKDNSKLESNCYDSSKGKEIIHNVDVKKIIKSNKPYENNKYTMIPQKIGENMYIMTVNVH